MGVLSIWVGSNELQAPLDSIYMLDMKGLEYFHYCLGDRFAIGKDYFRV